jgi:hypothetical protein
VGGLADLRRLGVQRVTLGPKLMQDLAPDLQALVAGWR